MKLGEKKMRVFAARPDLAFQSFTTRDPSGPETRAAIYGLELLNCKPMLPGWIPQPLFLSEPERKVGNFAKSWGGGLVVDSYGRQVLGPVFEESCELLPMLPFRSETFRVMNVLLCADCLDEASTKWRTTRESGVRCGIDKYEFSKESLPNSSLFKIPQSPEIMVVTGLFEPELDFKSIVERNGLTGLKFVELWSDT